MQLTNMRTQYEYGKIGGCSVSYISYAGATVNVTTDNGLTFSYRRKLTDNEGNVWYEPVDNIHEAAPGDYVKDFKFEDKTTIGETSAEFVIIKATPAIKVSFANTTWEYLKYSATNNALSITDNNGNPVTATNLQYSYKTDDSDDFITLFKRFFNGLFGFNYVLRTVHRYACQKLTAGNLRKHFAHINRPALQFRVAPFGGGGSHLAD